MKVSESQFLSMFMPTCHAALVMHAMYYGEGDYANRKLNVKQIAAAMECDAGTVKVMLDLADRMLADASQLQPGTGSERADA